VTTNKFVQKFQYTTHSLYFKIYVYIFVFLFIIFIFLFVIFIFGWFFLFSFIVLKLRKCVPLDVYNTTNIISDWAMAYKLVSCLLCIIIILLLVLWKRLINHKYVQWCMTQLVMTVIVINSELQNFKQQFWQIRTDCDDQCLVSVSSLLSS